MQAIKNNDINNIFYKEKIVYKALEELDDYLFSMGVSPITLNVIGGFALLLNNIRLSDYTDIDYIGDCFDSKIEETIDEIGLRYGLGRGWVNNNVLLSGSNIDDFECCTGKLNFVHKLDLKAITVNALDIECLLRMKVIAIDTSYMATQGGEKFLSRAKDLIDIKLIAEKLGYSFQDIRDATDLYVIDYDCYYLIKHYMKYEDLNVFSSLDNIRQIVMNKGN